MNFQLNRINPNQTQVMFTDGRFETLTNEELEYLLAQTDAAQSIQYEEEGVAIDSVH
ncbi:hypothetical protein H1Z61_12790 [Bacillus aquiflavi]|uniref:Uncharacterized protein n=1 Tax=Bacillus aquiflavi TaxID=2672567 RepID=A0A6B3W2Y5_9BACI|nr:hypothetical protein [Bacillus aquiflavi]MBA4537985.1 hypothetical protein [Bacillus aquiflavi]NEY82241.1 hypothetical protein [Bacillus aquiflavi]UAC50163.1 hypothetical protein K6959_08905 [Bacillus aquiflavi]